MSTSGSLPVNSVVSIYRGGSVFEGGKVTLTRDANSAVVSTWSHEPLQPGDEVRLESVAFPPHVPIVDRWQRNRQAMQDPHYIEVLNRRDREWAASFGRHWR